LDRLSHILLSAKTLFGVLWIPGGAETAFPFESGGQGLSNWIAQHSLISNPPRIEHQLLVRDAPKIGQPLDLD
jgi:hypothetical protein